LYAYNDGAARQRIDVWGIGETQMRHKVDAQAAGRDAFRLGSEHGIVSVARQLLAEPFHASARRIQPAKDVVLLDEQCQQAVETHAT
jgi:hypothetical protein